MKVKLHERLDGQVALVTGSTRGLGAAITAKLFDLGATVYAGARNTRDIAQAERDTDGQVVPVRLDVREERTILEAVQRAVTDTGRLDIVVNNAGIGDFHGRTLGNLETDLLDEVLATNLRGPILVAKHALPQLLVRPGGRIVNISSGMGSLTDGMGATAAAYRITKTGLNALTSYLHAEYGPRGVLANSVCPGWVRTDMGGPNAPRSIDEGAETPVWLCRFQAENPSGLFWRDKKVIPW